MGGRSFGAPFAADPVRIDVVLPLTGPGSFAGGSERLIASKVKVILGSALTATCNAMAALVKNGPLMYCFSGGYVRYNAATSSFSGVSKAGGEPAR